MTLYNKINNLVGWVVFIIATAVYYVTSEPTGSFWDCGEFISCAYKMQVAHSPGAPLFLMIGRMFTMFASEPSSVARMANLMSNVMGGLTSLFLFWTITALALKIFGKKLAELSMGEILAIVGAGLVGAFASTFSDSTWFSTVEGEVYSSSAAFTAFVMWGILKWEAAADTKYGDKWLLMVAYAMGLSIGVHLLNLLCIPAMVFVYYFKKYPYSRWGLVKTFIISCVILGTVQFGVIQRIPLLAATTDILFVNKFNLQFNSGSLFFMAMLLLTLGAGLVFSQTGSQKAYFTFVIALIFTLFASSPVIAIVVLIIFLASFFFTKNYVLSFLMTFTLVIPGYLYWYFTNKDKDEDPWNNRPVASLNKVLLALIFIIIGYSSYTMVLIRASANPSINMSNPKDLVNLKGYLDREQYGDRPLAYGPVFTARPTEIDMENGEMKYRKGETKYDELGRKPIIKYDASEQMIFPRIFDNDDPSHVRFYRSWLSLGENEQPTFGDNVNFFVTYQVMWMYWRYFMWNFAGRQNDVQGSSGYVQDGNWISGISFIDNMRLGDQDNLPASMANNKAKNKFYFLPLILGLIGMFYHFRKTKNDAFVVLLLFFFTGIAIVLYLNQTPLQPRERDYAYQGSVYAFCIWIGIGVLALYEWLRTRTGAVAAAGVATLVCASVPTIMAAQGWDDHDRSNRYTARDFGKNYLESCAPNAILFTQGDNDTYPLWYAQEVEGIRTDVRVVNLSLLGVDWYIDQLRRKQNNADALDLSITSAQVRGTNHDYIRYYKDARINQDVPYNIKDVVSFMMSEDDNKKILMGDSRENFLPARKLFIPVDKKLVIDTKVVQPEDTAKIVDRVEWTLNRTTLLKPSLMVLDIIQQNNWKRPIYFAISVNSAEYLGLNDYMQQEGLTYRLVPVKQTDADGLPGGVQRDLMYKNLMTKFAWGGVDKHDVYLDENILRMVTNLRSNFARLSTALANNGDNARAIEVLDKCQQVLPEKNVPYSLLMLPIAQAYYKAGANEKGLAVCNKLMDMYAGNMKYFASLDGTSYQSYYKSDMNEAVYVLFEISQIAERNKQTELLNKVKPLFEKYQRYYTQDKQDAGGDE